MLKTGRMRTKECETVSALEKTASVQFVSVHPFSQDEGVFGSAHAHTLSKRHAGSSFGHQAEPGVVVGMRL